MNVSYIIHAAILISLFYVLYRLLLSRETYYQVNRGILLVGIMTCFLLPLIPTPYKLYFDNSSIESFTQNEILISEQNQNQKPSVQDMANPNLQATQNNPSVETASHNTKTFSINPIHIVYLIGFSILLLNLIFQLINIGLRIHKYKQKDKKLIVLPFDVSPCSFFGFTMIDSKLSNQALKKQVIKHEGIHNSQWHSIDILLAEIMVAVLWFNPLAWLYRIAVEQNLEYLVDDHMVQNATNKKDYQYNLLQLAVPNFPLSIVTNYNQSLIKKRITMMNTKKSSTKIGWKYLLFLPFIMLSMISLNQPMEGSSKISIAQLNSNDEHPAEKLLFIIPANTSQEDLEQIKKSMESYGYELKIKEAKWDDNQYLTTISLEIYYSDNDYPTANPTFKSFNDLNRFMSIVINLDKIDADKASNEFYAGPGSSWSINFHDSNSLELNMMYSSNRQSMSKCYVYAPFESGPIPFKEFLNSEKLEANNQIFSKEIEFMKIYQQDFSKGSSNNIYNVNGKNIEMSQLIELLETQEIISCEVKQSSNDLYNFNIQLAPQFVGFQSIGGSSNYNLGYNKMRTLKLIKSNLRDKLQRNNVNDAIYFLDSTRTNLTLDNLDTNLVKAISFTDGMNYDDQGNFLGREVRLYMSSTPFPQPEWSKKLEQIRLGLEDTPTPPRQE